MRWPWQRRFGPGGPTSELDASGAATILSSTYGSEDYERILPTFNSYVTNGYAGNSIVFSVILARLMLFSEAEFKWRNSANKKLFGDRDLTILESPWPNGTTAELLVRMEQDGSIAGNAYIRNVLGEDQLERLRPDRVTIVSELLVDQMGRPFRRVRGFAYDRNGDGNPEEFYTVDEVAHWSPIPDPVASFRGMSWLTPVVREVNADQGLTDYKIQYLEHGATPNMLVRYDKQLKPETITAVEARLDARHGGVGNAGKTIVLDQGADTTIVGNTFEQMNFTTVQAAGENRIAAAGGTPGIVVGLKEGLQAATYSNYGQAMRRFADITMRPNWRSACGALATLVPAHPGARLWFDTTDIAALQAGEKERADIALVQAQTALALVQAGFTRESIPGAATSGDLLQLVPDPNAPTPGTTSRLTVTNADPNTPPFAANANGNGKAPQPTVVP